MDRTGVVAEVGSNVKKSGKDVHDGHDGLDVDTKLWNIFGMK